MRQLSSSEKDGPADFAVDDLALDTLPDPSTFFTSLENAGAFNPSAFSPEAFALTTLDHAAPLTISTSPLPNAALLELLQPLQHPVANLASPHPLDFSLFLPSTKDGLNCSTFATPSDISTASAAALATLSHPTTTTSASPSSSTSQPAVLTPASYLAEQAARSVPTGFRDTSVPRIALDAPVQKRDSLLPSATSRKRLNAAGERKLAAKRRREQQVPSESSTYPSGGEFGAAAGLNGGEEVPQEALTATERKRLQNTLSARRCRMREQARVHELEIENAALREQVEQLEAMLRLVGGSV
ncbi:hypothetical protein JCM10295v2_006617 [Rhodotorula toruloides]